MILVWDRVPHAERAPYPSYTADDHEKALGAATKAVEAAQAKARAQKDSKVRTIKLSECPQMAEGVCSCWITGHDLHFLESLKV